MTLGHLLKFRARASLRRATSNPLIAIAVIAGAFAALFGVFVGLRELARADLTETDVRDRVFWLGTLTALVYSYTTFEVFFRARDADFLGTLPLSQATRFDDLYLRALTLHLPLLLPSLAYALALALERPDLQSAFYVLAVSLTQFAVGLPIAIALHLWAGSTLLSGSSGLKRALAGATVVDDAALLVYAPALGLLATLVLGIFLDLSLRDAILRGRASMLAAPLLGAFAVSAFALLKARQLASTSLYRILPRFAEVDVPPPYREDGIRQKVPQEWLAPYLPSASRPYFLRDIRQLRRRFRLDRILVWTFALVALKVAHDASDAALRAHVDPTRALIAASLTALWLLNGVFIVAAFRLRGELASPWLDATLPGSPGAERLGRLAATALYPLATAVVAALAVLTTGDALAAALVLALGLLLALALVLGSHLIAHLGRAYPALASTLWRIGITALGATLGAL